MVIPDFIFARAPKINFGQGVSKTLGKIISEKGRRVLLVTGAKSFRESERWSELTKSLKEFAVETYSFTVNGEPSPELVDQAVTEFADRNIDVLAAVGGGSAIDAGKAISAMLPHKESVLDYLEGVGTKTHSGMKVPFIAVPTTAGTGSEATKNAVLSRTGDSGFKKSLRHENLVPDIAVVDPELAISCPPSITAACGMDAFTQLLESYVSPKSSPVTDSLAYSGINALKESLIPLCTTECGNVEKRASLAYASLMSGITLANAGLGVVHGFASVLGGFFDIPHGVVCGTLVGSATKTNIDRLKEKESDRGPALEKYADIGRLVAGKSNLSAYDACSLLIERIEEWTNSLNLPLLSDYGVTSADVERIVQKTGSKDNAVHLEKDDIKEILLRRAGV